MLTPNNEYIKTNNEYINLSTIKPQITTFNIMYSQKTNFTIESNDNHFINPSTLTNVINPKNLSRVDKAIDHTDIKINDEYMTCQNCKHTFSIANIILHLYKNSTCPLCKSELLDKTIYSNKKN